MGYWGACGACFDTTTKGLVKSEAGVGWCYDFSKASNIDYAYWGSVTATSSKSWTFNTDTNGWDKAYKVL